LHTFDLFRISARFASASLSAAGSAGGAALGAAVHVIAAARNVPKPLHPRGRYTHATVTRFGSPDPSGVPWLDEKGTGPAVVRHSGAIGLPLGSPDIQGIAVRVHEGRVQGDLLFATTGLGRFNRYILTGSTRIDGRPYTTLLPYRGPFGPVLLGLEPQSPTTMTLLWAHGSGNWHVFGSLQLTDPYDGPAVSFDPMLKTMPGLIPYPWVRALRAPAYRVARRHRDGTSPSPNNLDDVFSGRDAIAFRV
jgi:hypothetical protein